MPDPSQPLLTPDQLLDGWTPKRVGRRVLTLAEASSTNSVALASAGDSAADGLAVFADYQSAGRGRQGRSWLAPRGAGILCSILLRSATESLEADNRSFGFPPGSPSPLERVGHPNHHSHKRMKHRPVRPRQDGDQGRAATTVLAGRLTLASAVAVCEAIRRATDVSPAIKWPNDLRVSGRKLAGILIESRVIDSQTRVWVIGIGINCHQHPGHFSPELRDTATSLEMASNRPIDRTEVARELLKSLDTILGREESHASDSIHSRWLALAEPLGQRIRLRIEGREYDGRTVAVDPTGGLIVQCDDGRRQWFDPLFTSIL